MKVILKKSMPDLGEPGQVIQVKDGFARNYLIPKGIAQPATGQNLKHLTNLKGLQDKRKTKLLRDAEDLSGRIAQISLTIAKPVGENDRLFGTVTPMEVAEALAAQGIEVDKRKILIQDPIKSLGEYTIDVKLHADVHAPLKLQVVPASA